MKKESFKRASRDLQESFQSVSKELSIELLESFQKASRKLLESKRDHKRAREVGE